MKRGTRTGDVKILLSNVSDGQGSSSKMFKRPADFEKLYRNRFPAKGENPDSCPIDPNHTHFILLDDCCGPSDEEWTKHGYPSRADLVLQLRAEIEQEARKHQHDGQSRRAVLLLHQRIFFFIIGHEIPIVQILIEGGPSSVLTICEAVEHKTPVIIIQVRSFDST